MWPSFTGGMVTQFQSEEAEEMLTWLRDGLWPYVHPAVDQLRASCRSRCWPAMSGSPSTTRPACSMPSTSKPEKFVAFPAPAGPAGRGFMPVIVGLGIPKTAPNPENGAALIDYLTRPGVQEQILRELGFFPVVGGVNTTNLPAGRGP